MHPYSIDSSRAQIVGYLMFVSVLLAIVLSAIARFVLGLLPVTYALPAPFALGTISALTLFSVLLHLFNRQSWKWSGINRFSSPPDIGGTWVGELHSSYTPSDECTTNEQTDTDTAPNGGRTRVEPRIEITQTWTEIEIVLTNPTVSISESTTASFIANKGRPELVFTYMSRPIGDGASSREMHGGTNRLRLTRNEDGNEVLTGEYYTDQQRHNHGTMEFRRQRP